MNVSKPDPGPGTGLGILAIAAPIALLFAAVFRPEMVLFSNDGTLGALFSQGAQAHEAFSGLWKPLNWVGEVAPSAQTNLTLALFLALQSAVAFSKFYVPLSLLFLGVSAAWFCRRAGLGGKTAILVGIAAALNSNPVSYACWGLAPKALTQGFALLALGLLLQSAREGGWRTWVRVALAGLTVGCCVTEGADVGAIFSLLVAAFTVVISTAGSAGTSRSWVSGILRLGLVAGCAGWLASHSLSTLVGTQIVGVSGMSQTRESEAQRWQFASAISLPPVESLRIIVPGLFGYRMDSPDGGAYWGAVGFDGTAKGRWSGAGEYAGILVVLVASYAAATSLRKKQSPYSEQERRMVWFWTAVAAGSLALSWGHFAPFYRIFFTIPYLSTIRIPSKFLHVMHLALWVVFAYGLEAIARGSLASGKERLGGWKEQFATWRKTAASGEVNWVFGALGCFAIAAVGTLNYAGSASELKTYLRGIEFHMGPPATAEFSIGEVWKALGFFALSLGLVAGMITGFFNGTRARIGWMLLGAVLVVDLYRANTPWVKHYDWVTRYQSNPVLDLLKDKPWEQRVTAFLDPHRQGPLVGGDAALSWTYLQKEWLENQFQYFNIQSLDISQMPRVPELETAYFGALGLMENQSNLPLVGRLWQLTNTRYILGSKDVVDQLNGMVDPVQKRIRLKMPFGLGLKPGVPPPDASTATADVVQLLTATASEAGPFAVLEFTGTLPRTKFYTDWQAGLDDAQTLQRLRAPDWDPTRQVLVSEKLAAATPSPTAASSEATITRYAPKHITVKTRSSAAGLLLLNDRWHPDWKVTVDGQATPLLRANFLMRGVSVPAGEHTVEYRFDPPHQALWASLSAVMAALLLVGILVLAPKAPHAD
ncbi:MAG: hypothetical protein QE510_06665 [Verrucomicrobiota bacterium]|nr:hypothetical protein [Verrucomicrobiota bacterium]